MSEKLDPENGLQVVTLAAVILNSAFHSSTLISTDIYDDIYLTRAVAAIKTARAAIAKACAELNDAG